MENHRKLSDEAFEAQFKSCQLNPKDFTHEAHLRLAWINIKKNGVHDAIPKVQSELKRYVDHLGANDKYNDTLTVAAVKAVYHFTLKSKAESFEAFISEFPRLKHNFKELMAAHYGFDIYKSIRTKKSYLSPDLLPFDV